MEPETDEVSWVSRLGWTFVFVSVFMLLELLPLFPVTRAAWGALFWIALGLTACGWIHFEVIGFPEDDEPEITKWLHSSPWFVLAIILFFGQDWWWSDFMETNFRTLWSW